METFLPLIGLKCFDFFFFFFILQERSRSPPPMRSYSERYHYDDPRRELREEEMYRQRIREETRSSNLTSDMRYTSPLQGKK